MALLALYQNWRPWHETDGYIVAIVLALLLLLVIFHRFRSFLANGVFVGCAFGTLCALGSSEHVYSRRVSYVEMGIFLGLLVGGLTKTAFSFAKDSLHAKSEQVAPTRSEDSHSPAFWLAVLAISGISVGLTLAAFVRMTDEEMVF